MSYRRARRDADAARVLAGVNPSAKIKDNLAYFQRLLFYKGLKKETELAGAGAAGAAGAANPAMEEIQQATLWYGIGNHFLGQGDTARARAYFERSLATRQWTAFGYIASEVELARLGR
jgi:hypothetical protein